MSYRTLLVAFVLLASQACAKGSNLDGIIGGGGAGGSGGEGGIGQNLNGSGASNNTAGPGPSSADVSTSSNGGNTSSNTTSATNTNATNATNSTSATTSSGPSNTTSGGTMCDPTAPSAGCGPSMHCVPTLDVNEDPSCAPAGSGGPYALCADPTQCAPENECVSDGLDTCCMTWCVLGGSDCSAFETCTELGAPLYANGQAYGVCWDGYPCVL